MNNITTKNVKNWLGSDVVIDDCISIIRNIANGDYSVKILKNDIETTIEQ